MVILLLILSGCFPAGIVTRSGLADSVQFTPSLTRNAGRPYRVYCQAKNGFVEPGMVDASCLVESEHSSFFLFYILPVSDPADYYNAAYKAIIKYEGDDMISIISHREIHNYGIPGRSIVVLIKGYVIRYGDAK